MKKADLIYKATYAHGKNYDYETMGYSREMYGDEQYMDEVWDYVIEINEEGTKSFKEKYKDYKMYWGF